MSPDSPILRDGGSWIRLGRLASAVLGLTVLGTVGLLTLAATRLGWPPETDQFLVYVVAPLVTVAILTTCLRSNPEIRVGAALLVIATGAAFVTAEVGATFVLGARTDTSPAPGRLISDLVDSLRSEDVRAYPTVPGNVLVDRDATIVVDGRVLHPVTPVPSSVTAVLCGEFSGITYRSDRYGFNNADSVWDAAPVDFALSGDSYVHGVCVPPDRQLGHLMSRDHRTVNLGSRGAGPLQSLAILREYGALIQPEVVVWVFYEGNDLYDLRRELQREWLVAYLADEHRQGLSEFDGPLDAEFGRWIDSLMVDRPPTQPRVGPPRAELSSIVRLTSLRSLFSFMPPFPRVEATVTILPLVLAAARRQVASWGGEMYLAYLPAYERYGPGFTEGIPGKAAVLASARDAGISTIDLDSLFRAEGSPTAFWAHPRGHLNAAGYLLMAEAFEAIVVAGSDGRGAR